MPRPTQPFAFETEADSHRPHHLRVKLVGDLDATPKVTADLEALAKAVTDGIKTVVIFDTSDLRPMPEDLELWLAFVLDLPDSIQLVYAPSLFADRFCGLKEYVKRRSNHVLVDSWYDK